MTRAEFWDWFWHRMYWATFDVLGAKSPLVTDLAEKCIETRMRVWQEQNR